MHAAAVVYDLHLPHSSSLKEKRRTLRPLLDGLRARHHVSVSEVGGHDLWQRTRIAVAVVGGDPGHLSDVLDSIDRFVWSTADAVVLGSETSWLELGEGLAALDRR